MSSATDKRIMMREEEEKGRNFLKEEGGEVCVKGIK